MKRTLEFTLVLMIAVLSVTTTASVLHDIRTGADDPVAAWLRARTHAVAVWMFQSSDGVPVSTGQTTTRPVPKRNGPDTRAHVAPLVRNTDWRPGQ